MVKSVEDSIDHNNRKDFIKLSYNEDFISYAVSILNDICPIKKCNAQKHTNEDYLRGILKVFEKFTYWSEYDGHIKWKTLHAKYRKFISLNFFEHLHEHFLEKYLSTNRTNKLKYQSIDSTSIINKQGIELVAFNRHKGTKRSIKVSIISDTYGAPLAIHPFKGNRNDVTSIDETLEKIPIDLHTNKYSNNNRYKQYLLADAGYCSSNNRKTLKKNGYTPLIWHNKRNGKYRKKSNKFNKKQLKIYQKRRIVESTFSWLKRFPKINILCEKTSASFTGMLLLVACYILTNKT